MQTNNLKYIEPPQPQPIQPPVENVVEEIKEENQDIGNKNTIGNKKGGKK